MALKRKSQKNKSNITFSEAKEIVYEHKKLTQSKVTADNYVKAMNELIYYFDDCEVKSVTKEDAYDFLDYLLNDKIHYRGDPRRSDKVGLAPRSVNSYLAMCKGMYTVLLELGYIKHSHDVFRNIEQLKYQKKKPKVIKPSELKKLVKSLDKRYYTDLRLLTCIYVMLESYGRIGEILPLTEDDVDFDRGIITFNQTKNNLFRSVPVSKQTIKIMSELLETNQRSFPRNHNRFFLTNTGRQMKYSSLKKSLLTAAQRAGLKQHVTFHYFRHTAATNFIRQGGSIKTLQYYLGHSDINVTEIYLHEDDEYNRQTQQEYTPLNILKENTLQTRRGQRSHRQKFR